MSFTRLRCINFYYLSRVAYSTRFQSNRVPLSGLVSSSNELNICHCKLLCTKSSKEAGSNPELEKSDFKDHIQQVHDYLVNFAIPKFFAIRHPWAIYSKDVYFENRVFDEVETAKGLDAYGWLIMKYRFGAILKFARSKLEVMASRVDDNEISIHWRFSGLPQSVVFLAFWKFKPWKMKEAKQKNSRVIEGISTLTFGSDHLIHKHVIDRLVLDPELEAGKTKEEMLLEKVQKLRKVEKAIS